MDAHSTSPGPLRLGVLISGGGSTLENLIQRIADRRLRGVEIRLVISSRSTVRGVEIARAAGLPLEIIRRKDHPDDEAFSDALTAALDRGGVDLVLLAGFLCFWRVPRHYAGRVLNIHPALLPRFGGKGFYGRNVHEAVLAAGQTQSGCTVHLVDNQYDHGPIVAQARVAVHAGDTPDTLAQRVGVAERELYPQVIQTVADEGLGWLRQFWSAVDSATRP
jgi:formyltetrahydrofolate-dependent phosphoribosylglycinamide formyltransferase